LQETIYENRMKSLQLPSTSNINEELCRLHVFPLIRPVIITPLPFNKIGGGTSVLDQLFLAMQHCLSRTHTDWTCFAPPVSWGKRKTTWWEIEPTENSNHDSILDQLQRPHIMTWLEWLCRRIIPQWPHDNSYFQVSEWLQISQMIFTRTMFHTELPAGQHVHLLMAETCVILVNRWHSVSILPGNASWF
jgi:hypothetical protein